MRDRSKYETFLRCTLILLLVGVSLPLYAQDSEEEKPWALRDHFALQVGPSSFRYDVGTTEWGLHVEGVGDLIDHAWDSITLADGTVINVNELKKEKTERTAMSNELGDGHVYSVDMEPVNGLRVRHTVAVAVGRPFVLIQLSVVNESEAPVEIAQISPVRIPSGSLQALGEDFQINQRRLVMHGPHPVFDKDTPPLLVFGHSPEKDVSLMLGFFPQGVARSSMQATPEDGGWACDMVSVFDPPLRVAPGKSLASDPVWFSFAIPEPSEIDLLYAWTHSTLPDREEQTDWPDAWVTAREGASSAELMDVATAWRGSGISHVLVPAGWEGRPGGLRGVSPAYPRDMGQVAKKFIKMKLTPGLSVDPLAVQGGSDDWVFKDKHGTRWINPTVPAAAAHAAGRLEGVVRAGFGFLVVTPSDIPEAALRQFNITKTQAETLAFAIAEQGAGGRPVVAAGAKAMAPSLEAMLQAAGDTGRLREYGVLAGPLRIALGPTTLINDNIAAAIALHGGPIEYVGAPKASGRRSLAANHPRSRLFVRALDFRSPASRLWYLQRVNAKGEAVGGFIAEFPDPPVYEVNDLGLDAEGAVPIWRPEDDTLTNFLRRSKRSQD